MKNRKLSGKFQQVSLHRLVERLKSKASHVVQVDRFYPSSKTCCNCGKVKKDLTLSDRTYKCACGIEIDRDLNASINIVRRATSEFTLVDNLILDYVDEKAYIVDKPEDNRLLSGLGETRVQIYT